MTAVVQRPEDPGVGQVELGRIEIADSVVAKIAAKAAVEVPDAGAAAPRVLGRAVSGVGALGVRRTDLQSMPKASAKVDGAAARLELTISVRWPHSVPDVSAQVRRNVIERVAQLAGLQVTEVNLDVIDLATDIATPPRVR